MILPLIGLTAVQFTASSAILSVMTGLSFTSSVVVVVFVVTVYSVMGGLWSVTLTDAVQWILIVTGLILAIPFAVHHGGGWEAALANVPREKMSVSEGIGWKTIISLTIMYIASFAVGQETVQRYFAAKDAATARRGSLYAAGAYLVFAFAPALLGVLAFGLAQNGDLDTALIEAEGTKFVLPVLAAEVLPSWLTGLVFAALISATMSSADSDLLAAGSIYSNDIYARFINRKATDREILKMTRMAMVAIAAASMLVALATTESIVALLMFSFSLRAGGAFIPYVVGHYWKKASGAGCLAAICAGSATVILAEQGMLSFFGFDPIIPGLMASASAYLLFSRLFPPRSSSARCSCL
jgi:SSS family solute:Na+ symporter